jgi:hypothetical protein
VFAAAVVDFLHAPDAAAVADWGVGQVGNGGAA